jgi:hypothetical protein
VSGADGHDPEQEARLVDSVGLVLLVVLETLAPAERFAFDLDRARPARDAWLDPHAPRAARGGGSRWRAGVDRAARLHGCDGHPTRSLADGAASARARPDDSCCKASTTRPGSSSGSTCARSPSRSGLSCSPGGLAAARAISPVMAGCIGLGAALLSVAFATAVTWLLIVAAALRRRARAPAIVAVSEARCGDAATLSARTCP